MKEIWHVGRLGEDFSFDRHSRLETISGVDGDATPKRYSDIAGRSVAGWSKLGLTNDLPGDGEISLSAELELFRDVGELGLECLVSHLKARYESRAASTERVSTILRCTRTTSMP